LLPMQETIITHAGISYPYARFVLEQMNAREIVQGLNDAQRNNDRILRIPGAVLNEGGFNPMAGPFWAISTHEVYSTWTENYPRGLIPRQTSSGDKLFSGGMPFNQIHGHTSPYQWEDKEWFPTTTPFFQHEINLYHKSRTSRYCPDFGSGA